MNLERDPVFVVVGQRPREATRTISTYSRMLKLNPAGRQSAPASDPEPISAYERIALEAQRDERN
jgi:hypothetical protein